MAWSDFTTVTTLAKTGDQSVSAAPTGAADAELISAATNANGIIITGVSLTVTMQGATVGPGSPYIRLLVGGVVQLENIHRRLTSDLFQLALGGICAIEVPAGQAVSYQSSLGGTTSSFFGFVRVAWRHKA